MDRFDHANPVISPEVLQPRLSVRRLIAIHLPNSLEEGIVPASVLASVVHGDLVAIDETPSIIEHPENLMKELVAVVGLHVVERPHRYKDVDRLSRKPTQNLECIPLNVRNAPRID